MSVIIYQGPSLLEPSVEIVCIVTDKSDNVKTGDMWQSWIMRTDQHPLVAVHEGHDRPICGDCVHRGVGDDKRSCYVNVAWAPAAIYRAFIDGRYERPRLYPGLALDLGIGALRIGAYGDPAALPTHVWSTLLKTVKLWTGYTHQWRTCDQQLRRYCMASVDSPEEQREAGRGGWRTYRVRRPEEPSLDGEIICPASAEAGHRTTCVQCALCDGKYPHDRRTNIVIMAHGSMGGAITDRLQQRFDWNL